MIMTMLTSAPLDRRFFSRTTHLPDRTVCLDRWTRRDDEDDDDGYDDDDVDDVGDGHDNDETYDDDYDDTTHWLA